MKYICKILLDLFISCLVFYVSLVFWAILTTSFFDPANEFSETFSMITSYLLAIFFALQTFMRRRSGPPPVRKKHRIPRNIKPKMYAQHLLSELNRFSDIINSTVAVDQFVNAYEMISLILRDLIWINECRGVKMKPHPRKDWYRVNRNMANTINYFFDRVFNHLPYSSALRASAIESFLSDVERSDTLSSLLRHDHHLRLDSIRNEAAAILAELDAQRIAYEENNQKADTLRYLGLRPCLDASGLSPFDVSDNLEQKLRHLYYKVLSSGFSPSESYRVFSNFRNACESSLLPLAADIRLEELFSEYEPKFKETHTLYSVDHMNGLDFEHWCAGLLISIGFQSADVTKASNDHGVDILAVKDGIRYAVQCKCRGSNLGNTSIQEVHAGKDVYHCQIGAVITNRYFTSGGKQVAEATGTLLWDRDWIIEQLQKVQ